MGSSRASDSAHVGRVPETAHETRRRGHPLRDPMVQTGHDLGGRALVMGHGNRQAAAASPVRDGALRTRLYGEYSARGSNERRGYVTRVQVRRHAARTGPWLPITPARAAPLLLEVGEMVARTRVYGEGPR